MHDSCLAIPNAAQWPEQPLNKLCELVSRGTAPVYVERSDVMAIGQRCVTASGFNATYARPHSSRAMSGVLRPANGDVLLNSTGTGTIGRSCLFDGAGLFVVDAHVTTLRPSAGSLDGRWLNAILRSSWGQSHLERYCYSGSTNQVELNRVPLAATRIPTPPLGEQQAAAAILDTLDTTIRQTEAIIEKLKQVKQGLLHDLLTRGIDANGELRPSFNDDPSCYVPSGLGQIPRDWQVCRISSLVSRVTYGFTNPMPATAEGPWMLTAADIGDGVVEYGRARRTSRQEFARLSAKSRPSVGDILVTKDGSLGRVAVLDREDVCVNQSVAVLSPQNEGQGQFLALYLRSPVGQDRMLADAGGSTIKHIYITTLADMLVPRPSPQEAVEIGRRAEAIAQRIEYEGVELSKLQRLKSGLMSDLLTGRVRVTALLDQGAPK